MPAGTLASEGSYENLVLPRTPGLGKEATMNEMLSSGAIPSKQGVRLIDKTIRFSDVWKLADKAGVEFGLTREQGAFILRSGSAGKVTIPPGVRPLAHTHIAEKHTGNIQTLPSLTDINVLNAYWASNPDVSRPHSTLIWGSTPGNTTPFRATGTDRIKLLDKPLSLKRWKMGENRIAPPLE